MIARFRERFACKKCDKKVRGTRLGKCREMPRVLQRKGQCGGETAREMRWECAQNAPALGTTFHSLALEGAGEIFYCECFSSCNSFSNSGRYPAISSNCMMVVILLPASLLEAPQWKSFSLVVPKSK